MERRIAIIGAGSWGSAIAVLLAKKGFSINLWVRDEELLETVNNARENISYLPGVIFPSNIMATNDIELCVKDSDVIVLATPSHTVRAMVEAIRNYIQKGSIIVNLAKGIENETLLRMSEIIEAALPYSKVAVLTGPSHAEEVARDIPTAIVVSAKERSTAEYVQDVFMTPKFRVYTNPDLIGVELGGALKNIIALGAGIIDGLGFGDNTKSALMTRGIVEISRLGEAMGAKRNTFAGLSGIGDLIVTCTSMHSRNRRAGIAIGEGRSVEDVINGTKMVVEGVKTTKSAYDLSLKYDVEMPITHELYSVLYKNANVKNSVISLMMRSKTHEMEDIPDIKIFEW